MVQYLQVTTKYTNYLNTSQLKVDVYSFSSYRLLQIKILSGWHLMDLFCHLIVCCIFCSQLTPWNVLRPGHLTAYLKLGKYVMQHVWECFSRTKYLSNFSFNVIANYWVRDTSGDCSTPAVVYIVEIIFMIIALNHVSLTMARYVSAPWYCHDKQCIMIILCCHWSDIAIVCL